MKLIFVKSNKIGSRLIRWGTGQSASHVAVVFDELGGLVYHSYGKGVRVDMPNVFYETYKVVWQIPVKVDDPVRFHNLFLDYVDGTGYDYKALAYLVWRGLLNKFLGISWPKHNPGDEPDRYMCTEVAYAFFEVYAQTAGRVLMPDGQIAAMMPSDVFRMAATFLGVER